REAGGQSSLGGGGRYDGLMEQLGGKPTPGIGFGTGIERIIINLKRQEVQLPDETPLAVYVAYQTPAARSAAFKLSSELRRAGISSVASTGGRSLKSQLRHADNLGAQQVAIIGARELAEGTITLKDLREGGDQTTLPISDLARQIASQG